VAFSAVAAPKVRKKKTKRIGRKKAQKAQKRREKKLRGRSRVHSEVSVDPINSSCSFPGFPFCAFCAFLRLILFFAAVPVEL
jgi:hypothetical protein